MVFSIPTAILGLHKATDHDNTTCSDLTSYA